MHKYTTKELILELKRREEGKKKARIIWTKTCQRDCSYCCNKYESVIAQMQPLTDLTTLADRDEVIVTGGEPMLYPTKLIAFLKQVRKACPTSTLYLYTAKLDNGGNKTEEIIDLVDGIHFTLHEGLSEDDINEFLWFQAVAAEHPDKSFRLSVDPGIQELLHIIPAVWKEIRIKTWFTANNCPVPLDETLHLWKG